MQQRCFWKRGEKPYATGFEPASRRPMERRGGLRTGEAGWTAGRGRTGQHRAMQNGTAQGMVRQDRTGQKSAGQDRRGQGTARQGIAGHGTARHDSAGWNGT